MMPEMTKRQRDVYDFIGTYCKANGYPPSFREIIQAFGFSSTNAVQVHLKPLEKKGYITRTRGKMRTLRIVKEAPSP